MADAKLFRDDERFTDQVARAVDSTRRKGAGSEPGTDTAPQADAEKRSDDVHAARDGSGMTRTNAPSDRVRFMEQERADAWEAWADERSLADRSTSGNEYTAFIRAHYGLDQRGSANQPVEPAPDFSSHSPEQPASSAQRKWPEHDRGLEP